MKKISIMVILFFTLAGLTTGCSTDFSKEKHQAMKGKKSLEEKSYAKVPKAPPSALNGLGEGALFDVEHDSSFE